jgi:hypothetical protein
MNLNYTRLGVLLLRMHAIVPVAQSLPGIAMAIPDPGRSSEFAKYGIADYSISILLQPSSSFSYSYSAPDSTEGGRISISEMKNEPNNKPAEPATTAYV